MLKVSFIVSIPEIFIAIMACFILLFGLYCKKKPMFLLLLSIGTLITVIVFSLILLKFDTFIAYNGAFILDPFGSFLKIMSYISVLAVFVYSYKNINDREIISSEYFALSFFSLLGMMILISSGNFLTLYLGLELFALPLYALIAMSHKYKTASEAALKYFIMGAIASGLLLYGISLLYGVSGSFEFSKISGELMMGVGNNNFISQLGIVFVLSAVAFKLGAVPFHMWLPDIYQGAPAPITMFIASAPKFAAFAMAIRIITEVLPYNSQEWHFLFSVMAIASLAIGNITALKQTNLKRLLAYSTIAHIGFILLGILAGSYNNYSVAIFYLVTYVFTNLAIFALIVFMSHKNIEAENIVDFKGLGRREPVLACCMAILLFSLAGIPPMVGFYAKFLVLHLLIGSGFLFLAIASIIFTIIGAFYYLNIIRIMFFESQENVEKIQPVKYLISRTNYYLLSFNTSLVLIFGILPAPLLGYCLYASL